MSDMNAERLAELRLTPEKYEQLRGLTEAVEHGTARFITYEADLAARAFREIERLREGLEQLEAARAEAERYRQQYEALRAEVEDVADLLDRLRGAVEKARRLHCIDRDPYEDGRSAGWRTAVKWLRKALAEHGGGDERV